jgi:hypothetical protein
MPKHTLQTEFAHSPEIMVHVESLYAKYPGIDPDDPAQPLRHELIELLQKPLQRIVNAANRQMKETKLELGLADWSGVLVCVNDGFRKVPPYLVVELLSRVLSKTHYSNTDAFVYQTNHFVEFPDDPYARLLWHPMYANSEANDELVDFVNDLGRKWSAFAASEGAPADNSREVSSLDLTPATVVTGPRRNTPYTDKP